MVQNRGHNTEWFITEDRTGNGSNERAEQGMAQNRGKIREWFRTEEITGNGSEQSK